MKSASLLLLLALAAPSIAAEKTAATEDGTFAPREKLLSSYDALRKKSPFEFDPPKAPVVDIINPFEGISLAGYCGSGNTLTVYLLEGKEKKRLTVFGDGSPYKKRDDSGFRVMGINRGKSLKTTQIILEKDGRQGVVKFDDDVLHSKVSPQGGGQMILDKNGKPVPGKGIPRPVAPPVPPPTVQNNANSQVFIPGMTNQAPVQPTPGTQPGAGANGVPARPLPANFMDVPGQSPAQGQQPPNAGNQFQNRRKVVLPQ